jgi:hypothetical protein
MMVVQRVGHERDGDDQWHGALSVTDLDVLNQSAAWTSAISKASVAISNRSTQRCRSAARLTTS